MNLLSLIEGLILIPIHVNTNMEEMQNIATWYHNLAELQKTDFYRFCMHFKLAKKQLVVI